MLKDKLQKYNGVADCSVEFPSFTQFGTVWFAKVAEKDGLVSLLYPVWHFPVGQRGERDGSSLAFSNQR